MMHDSHQSHSGGPESMAQVPNGPAASNGNKGVKQRRGEQELHCPNNYPTKSDWDTLEGPTTLDCKRRVVAERFWNVGATNPSEQAIK